MYVSLSAQLILTIPSRRISKAASSNHSFNSTMHSDKLAASQSMKGRTRLLIPAESRLRKVEATFGMEYGEHDS